MGEWFNQVWREIAERPDGPLAMRFYLQPAMAIFFAVRDGLKDAKAGKPAYLWEVFSNPARRGELIRDGWKSVGRVFIIACVVDVVYGLIVLRAIHPVQSLLVATMLAIVPYIILRGPVRRIAERSRSRRIPKKAA